MIDIKIDGKSLQVEKGTTILHAARAAGIDIPTLCNHEGLEQNGNCRLCLVEVNDRGRKKLVASCMFPITSSVEIETHNERVVKARRLVIGLLADRCPDAERIKELCTEYGVTPEQRFSHEADLCIRCGRCVRACEVNGTGAIEFAGRGFERRIATPYDDPTDKCIGCLACYEVCPTGSISYTQENGVRRIWERDFELVQCSRCGEYYATKEMLDWAKVPEDERGLCDRCRKADESRKFLHGDKVRAEILKK